MAHRSASERRRLTNRTRAELEQHQLARLNSLLEVVSAENALYRRKLRGRPLPLSSLDELSWFPLTLKEDLIAPPEEPAWCRNLTWPIQRYVRFHQTSGTRGRPMIVPDTADDWCWWIDTWQYVLDAADVTSADRAMLAFSFGPFVGFWSAHDALCARGAMSIPGGGMSTLARLELMKSAGATLIFCTPTYALRMTEVARADAFDLQSLPVRRIVVAGEPGGSLPAVRGAIEKAFDAQVVDHSGATEVGPWGFADRQRRGLQVIESEFVAEFLDHDTGQPGQDGRLCELVLTNLGRVGAPVIRYRTGDLVRPVRPERGFVLLEGGVLGRADDMLIIRGVNVFPSAIENILRDFPEVEEYRLIARRKAGLDELEIEVEDKAGDPGRIAAQLQLRLGLRVEVRRVPSGSLPRFEAKGRRFVDQRQ